MRPSSILALALLLPLLASPSFGAPADDSRPIVQASEILAKIERGEPVEYDGVIVVGDLDVGELNLPTRYVESPISIKDSEIRGCAKFNNVVFQEPVSFEFTNFTEDARFSFVNFSSINADLYVVFSDYDFYDPYPTVIGSSANFLGSQFGGDAGFLGSQFSDSAIFQSAKFGGDATFNGAQFSGEAIFSGAKFSGDAFFENAKFSGNVIFVFAKFDGILNLRHIDFTHLYIYWSSIEHPVCDGVTYLKLIKNLKDLEQFEDSDNCYYDYRKWRQGEKSILDWSKYIDILAWITCGYGVRPIYTLWWGFVLIAIFGTFYWVGDGIYKITSPHLKNANDITEEAETEWCISSICCMVFDKISKTLMKILAPPKILRKVLDVLLKMRPSTIRCLPGKIWNSSFVTKISLKDALYFSTMVFVSQPPHDWRPKEGWKYWVMLEDVLGWLLLALFLVTLGNVMIR